MKEFPLTVDLIGNYALEQEVSKTRGEYAVLSFLSKYSVDACEPKIIYLMEMASFRPIVLVLLLCLPGSLSCFGQIKTEDSFFISPSANLGHLSACLAEYSNIWLNQLDTPDLSSIQELRLATQRESALTEVPMVKTATLNIFNELAILGAYRNQNAAAYAAVDTSEKPSLSPLTKREWKVMAKQEIEKNLSARISSTQRIVKANLDIIDRMAATPRGQKVSMLGSSPLLMLMNATIAQSTAEQKRKELLASLAHISVVVTQVLESGCIVNMETPTATKRAFIEGLTGPEMAEDQVYQLQAERDGVFQYKTHWGIPSTIEKYKLISID